MFHQEDDLHRIFSLSSGSLSSLFSNGSSFGSGVTSPLIIDYDFQFISTQRMYSTYI